MAKKTVKTIEVLVPFTLKVESDYKDMDMLMESVRRYITEGGSTRVHGGFYSYGFFRVSAKRLRELNPDSKLWEKQ